MDPSTTIITISGTIINYLDELPASSSYTEEFVIINERREHLTRI